MSDKKDGQLYEFQIKICSVKMKLKFPCRMALEHCKQPITKQVPLGQSSKFVFNDTVVLRGEGDGYSFQILMTLYTEKGTKYTSGSMKLLSAQLRRSKGQRLVIPLIKCLDPQAFCQLIVEAVTDIKSPQLNLSRSSKVLSSSQKEQLVSPLPKKLHSERFLIKQTRSQVNFHPTALLGSEQKRDFAPKSQVFKTFTKSPNSKISNIKYPTYNANLLGAAKSSYFPIQQGSQRPSFDDGQVYRQGYLKLKEKFKRQAELLKEQTRKKAVLENNENSLKLQVMKIKVKADEQEKQIVQKNQKIKLLSSQLSEYQKKDLDLAYIKQECSSLERKNKMQEETIASLLVDIDSVKKLMLERTRLDQQTISGLRQQLELAKNKVNDLNYEFQIQTRAKENIIATKNNDIQVRNDTIERQKQLIKDFEQQAQNKLFQYQKTLSSQRNFLQQRIDELKIKLSSIEGERSFIEQKHLEAQRQVEKLNTNNVSLQFKIKMLNQQLDLAFKQICELKVTKDKYIQLTKEHHFLQEQFQTVKKNLQATLQHQSINLSDLLAHYEQAKQRAQKIKIEQQQKIKLLSTSIHQKDVQVGNLNSLLEKTRRINEGLSKENQSLREQNKLIRQDIKNVQKKLLSFQSQYSSFQSQSTRQSNNLKSLLLKLKEERTNDQKKIDQLRQKTQKQADLIMEYEEKQSQWKIKQRHYEQKIQKDQNKHKESVAKHQSIIKNQQSTINDNQSMYENMSNDNRSLRRKISEQEIAEIRSRELMQKIKKDLKLSQEKNSLLDQHLKAKIEEQKVAQQKLVLILQKAQAKEQQLARLREKGIEEAAKLAKQQQISQLLAKQKEKLQKQTNELIDSSKCKDKSEEQLREELKIQKEEVVKQKMKTAKTQSEFQKFKESINDIIRIQFTRILNTPTTTQKGTQRLRQSQVSNAKSEKSRRSRVLDGAVISSNLMQKVQQAKSSLWKMAELNRILKQQNTKLMNHTENQTNRYQFNQLQLHRDIQLLEDQMNNIIDDKQKQCQHYDQLVYDLNTRLKEKEAEVQDLRSQIAQYEAIVNGLKTDFQVNNDLNDKKVQALKQSTNQLSQRIQYLNLNVACLQDKNHELQEKTIEQESEIISYKQLLIKNEKILIDTKENQSKITISLQSLKKQVKIKQQENMELQMHLNNEKESRQKVTVLLEEQEKKCIRLNQFANTLIMQKEKAIKAQLQKSQQNNVLQNQLFQLTHQRDLLQEEHQALKKKLDQSKQEGKTFAKSIKGLEKQLSEQKAKNVRSIEKLKELEKDKSIKAQYIKELQQKYKQLRDKNYREIRQLSNQLQDTNTIASNVSKQLNEKILKVESESKKRWQEALSLQSEVESLSQQLYLEKDKTEDQSIEISRLKEEKLALQEQIASRQFALQEREDEIQKQQKQIEELRKQIESLEGQYNLQDIELNHQVAQLKQDYEHNIDEANNQNRHRQQILTKENQQLKQSLQGIEQLLAKALHDHNSQCSDYQQKISSYEERFKKIEAERLNNILLKNNEIKKVTEEVKVIQERLRQKEGEVRKLSLQLQQRKNNEGQLQARITQLAEQAKNKEKIQEKEIEGLKIKEKVAQQTKQKIMDGIHQNQIQVRKIISEALKKLIESCCKADTEKVLSAMKGLEGNVVQAISKIIKQ